MPLEVDSWSTTAGSNSTIAGINIAENCLAANMNDAQRANMAAVKAWKDAVVATYAALGANADITSLLSSTALVESGTITAGTLGFRGIPQLTKTASYTLALIDAGKHVSITTGGIIIPANASVAFPIGAAVAIYNDSAVAQSIAITTDTLTLAGSGITGTRTLGAYGLATVLKQAATKWIISGVGLT